MRKRAYAMFGGGIRLAYAVRVGVSKSVFERSFWNAILFEFLLVYCYFPKQYRFLKKVCGAFFVFYVFFS